MKNEISHFNGKRPAHRILVVDGNEDTRRLNTEVLIQFGYHVDAAEDDTAGWEALQGDGRICIKRDFTRDHRAGIGTLN